MTACLHDDSAIAALQPEWLSLWQAVPDPCPFLSPAWLLPWWQVWGNGAPRVATLRGPHGRLDGILPLYRLHGRLLNWGAGVSDRFDALLRPGLPIASATILLAAALDGCALPCELLELPPGAALRSAPAPTGWHDATTPASPCPVLDLSAGLAAIPPLARRKWRMAGHRADRLGGWQVETGDALDLLATLHASRWHGQGALTQDVLHFLRRATPDLLATGALRLTILRIADRPAAAALALLAGTARILFYLGGWDPNLAAASPGTLLIGAMLRDAIAEGRREADFLRGAEPYKYRWGATDRHNATRTFTRA